MDDPPAEPGPFRELIIVKQGVGIPGRLDELAEIRFYQGTRETDAVALGKIRRIGDVLGEFATYPSVRDQSEIDCRSSAAVDGD